VTRVLGCGQGKILLLLCDDDCDDVRLAVQSRKVVNEDGLTHRNQSRKVWPIAYFQRLLLVEAVTIQGAEKKEHA
jgi:hypothetical protein